MNRSSFTRRLSGLVRRPLHAVTHPGLRVSCALCLAAAALFIVYFQFFFGPLSRTLAVLGFCAYAGLAAYNTARDTLQRRRAEAAPGTGFLARHGLQDSWIFWVFALISLLSNLFFLLMARLHHSTWFGVFALYNLVLFAINLFIGREMRLPGTGSGAPAREKKDARVVGILLIILSLVFTGITMETILRNQSKDWPAFVLAFQILFVAFRLGLYSHSAWRFRGDAGMLRRAVRTVNLSSALCALYTTQATFLARFCGSELLRLVLNLITAAVVFALLLRMALLLITGAHAAAS